MLFIGMEKKKRKKLSVSDVEIQSEHEEYDNVVEPQDEHIAVDKKKKKKKKKLTTAAPVESDLSKTNDVAAEPQEKAEDEETKC